MVPAGLFRRMGGGWREIETPRWQSGTVSACGLPIRSGLTQVCQALSGYAYSSTLHWWLARTMAVERRLGCQSLIAKQSISATFLTCS